MAADEVTRKEQEKIAQREADMLKRLDTSNEKKVQ